MVAARLFLLRWMAMAGGMEPANAGNQPKR